VSSSWRRIGLFAEAIVFTILVPGTVAFWLPLVVLDASKLVVPRAWSVVQFAALVPLAVGAGIYARCVWDFVTRGRGIPMPIDHPKQLVVSGLYRYVRNPMYLGVLLFLLGEALFLRYAAFVLYTAIWFGLVNLFVLLYEEPILRRKFGESYLRYTAAVGRWVPGRRRVVFRPEPCYTRPGLEEPPEPEGPT
jgi:protein-S-isoprenylcysteine O-methyltransferase Ste14